MTQRAIITSVHPYDAGLMVGSHHAARTLVRRGWQVLLLSNPSSSVHSIGGLFSERIGLRRAEGRRGAWQAAPNLTVLTPWTLVPLAGRFGADSAFCLDHWLKGTRPDLLDAVAQWGFWEPDLMMLDGAVYAPLLALIKPKCSVLRLFDIPGRVGVYPDELRQREEALARTVDCVAITSEELRDIAESWQPRRIVRFDNGCDTAHFQAPTAEPADLAAVPHPRVVYAGAIGPWVDEDLIDAVAGRLPDVSFVWIGPGGRGGTERANVHRLGAKRYSELPAYLQHADVAVIPFRQGEHAALTNAVNPLKLYEYLAVGLPVVATSTTALRSRDPPIAFADNVEDFAVAVRAAVDQRVAADDRRAFACQNDWEARITDLLAALGLADAL